jgi:voltage-gated potassium channel Kch
MTAAVIVTVIASILWKPLKMYRAWIVLGWLGFGTLLGLFAHVWQLFVVLVLLCAGLCIYAVFLRLRHAAAFKPRHE